MKLAALYTLLPLIASLPPLTSAHPTHAHSDASPSPSYRKTLNFGASHPHASYHVPATDAELASDGQAGLMARDMKDPFDVARRVVEKRLTRVLGRDAKEGESYYIRDDVSMPVHSVIISYLMHLFILIVVHRREDANHSRLY